METQCKGKYKHSGDTLERVAPGINLPSDYLTPKQIAELSGPVHVYYIEPKKGA